MQRGNKTNTGKITQISAIENEKIKGLFSTAHEVHYIISYITVRSQL